METLTASRQQESAYSCVTTIKDSKGFVKAILTGYQQPKKSQKTIEIKKELYNLKFE